MLMLNDDRPLTHPLAVIATIVLGMFLVTSLFWIAIHFGTVNPNTPISTNSPDLSVLFAALFGAATIILACTAVGIALFTLIGWRRLEQSVLNRAADRAIKAAKETAKPIARQFAEKESQIASKEYIEAQLKDGSILRSLMADRIREVHDELLSEPDIDLIDQIVSLKVNQAFADFQGIAIASSESTEVFETDEYGEAPSNRAREKPSGSNREEE